MTNELHTTLTEYGTGMVYLNGFKETIEYVSTLHSVKWIGVAKSDDGCSILQCYESN